MSQKQESCMKPNSIRLLLAGALVSAGLLVPSRGYSHCDTLDGPVVAAARTALEKKDVTPALKWIHKEDEPEIRAAFAKTIAVRKQGPEAKDLADQYFFETLVRVHRAGEGAPYTGLKPAGSEAEPGIKAADAALHHASIEPVIKALTERLAEDLRARFAEVTAKQKRADDSVEAGREFVAAYVAYIHYVAGLERAAAAAHSTEHHAPE